MTALPSWALDDDPVWPAPPEDPDAPLALDLYCCAGGASAGLVAAGFRVIGVDNVHRASYPYTFVRADALWFLDHLAPTLGAVFAWSSPPCQGEGAPNKGTNRDRTWARRHPRLITPTRERLERLGLPYVIENVAGSTVRKDIRLCGEMFGLGVIRHRYLELGGWTMPQPVHLPHRGYVRGWRHGVYRDGPYVADYGRGGGKATVAEMQRAKRMGWTDDHTELCEAVPPAYGEIVGRAALDHLRALGRVA